MRSRIGMFDRSIQYIVILTLNVHAFTRSRVHVQYWVEYASCLLALWHTSCLVGTNLRSPAGYGRIALAL